MNCYSAEGTNRVHGTGTPLKSIEGTHGIVPVNAFTGLYVLLARWKPGHRERSRFLTANSRTVCLVDKIIICF